MNGKPTASAGVSRAQTAATWGVILVTAAVVFAPLVRSAFFAVTFDDDAFVIDNPWIGTLSWASAFRWFGAFYHGDYVPLALTSFAVDHHWWGLWPGGYHLTNIGLHLAASSLLAAWAARGSGRVEVGLLAGGVFALHPVQLETVAIISQRKTLLATVFALLALLAYQRYLSRRTAAPYLAGLACFALGSMAKSSIVTLPALLVLYDWLASRRVRLVDKLPFLLVAGVAVWASIASKSGLPVVKAPHGGSHFATALLMGRVWLEYLGAVFAPLRLSAAYYYHPALAYSPWHAAALLLVIALHVGLWSQRARAPLAFFALFWFTLAMAPVANIVPIAVVRADRYMYFAIAGFCWCIAQGLARIPVPRGTFRWLRPPALALLLPLAAMTAAATPRWRDDVTIWRRVVAVHPWNARAHYLLGQAHANSGDWHGAVDMLQRSVTLDPTYPAPHVLLAQAFLRMGDIRRARAEVQELRRLTPEAPVPIPLDQLMETAPDG